MKTYSNPSLLPTLLLVLFVGLKLTDHIDWSWWWVLSPLWLSSALALLAIAVGFALLKCTNTKKY